MMKRAHDKVISRWDESGPASSSQPPARNIGGFSRFLPSGSSSSDCLPKDNFN